ncbi:unnamed protein product [Lasius platythorax]|uniref:Uncharacterized protein n=1 Tax=Lasius platythorax TaxID=488582 RepID=A0AAV2NCG8_9HYME
MSCITSAVRTPTSSYAKNRKDPLPETELELSPHCAEAYEIRRNLLRSNASRRRDVSPICRLIDDDV